MKKLLATLIISSVFTLATLVVITFIMRVNTPDEKKEFKNISDSIALNSSGQGISSSFIPKIENEDGFKFLAYFKISKDYKSGTLYVSVIKGNKRQSVKYPCQVQDNIIYSVGLEYARETTYSLAEYGAMALFVFLIIYSLLLTAKVIKNWYYKIIVSLAMKHPP